MIGLLELIVFGFLGLSVIYILVSIYAQSVERENLEKSFDAGGIDGARDAYIAAGLAAYQHSLRHKTLWLVYIIPVAVIILTAYLINSQ